MTDLPLHLTSAEDLFNEVQSAMQEYSREPNIRLFLFLIFALNHLREWIAEKSASSVREKLKSGSELTAAEKFCLDIWKLKEFQIVNDLCNKSKHISVELSNTLSTRKGAHVGSWVGDTMSQLYYLINGVDSRKIFYPLLQQYHNWFYQSTFSPIKTDLP